MIGKTTFEITFTFILIFYFYISIACILNQLKNNKF